jgi:hypothetical protein
MRTRIAFAVVLAAALALTACDKVPKPTSDSTPPTLHWSVHNADTGDTTELDGTAHIDAKVGHHFTITFKANDPEGVHEVTMGISTGFTCKSGSLVQSAGPGLAPEQKQTLNPDADNKVLTSGFLIGNVTTGPENCSPGFTFASYQASITGTGSNYFSGTTTATLTISAKA